MRRRPSRSTLFPYTTLFRSSQQEVTAPPTVVRRLRVVAGQVQGFAPPDRDDPEPAGDVTRAVVVGGWASGVAPRSEEHTSELQSLRHLVCRLLLEKKKKEKT